MSCCSFKKNRKSKKYKRDRNNEVRYKKRRNAIVPEEIKESPIEKKVSFKEPDNKRTKNLRVSTEFVDELMNEVILCGSCNKAFSLRSNEIVGNCGGCNKFLHCGIAGKCVGPNCSVKVGNEVCRLTWCYDCVPKNFLINLGKNNIHGDCLCLECSNDENVPKMYKRKM